MSVKVTVRKSNEHILFVEAGVDFIDFVFSLLTFPLGGVLHMLQGFSSLSGIDNLHKSLSELSADIYLMSEGLKDKLTKPLIAPHLVLIDQILPIGASTLPVNYCHTYYDHESRKCIISLTKAVVYSHDNPVVFPEMFVPFKLADSKSSIAKLSFVKGPSMFMMTDDLFVTPMSSISAMSHIKRLKVPLSDLEERVIKIGVKEASIFHKTLIVVIHMNLFSTDYNALTFAYLLQGLSILKASLISTSALQYGLKQFIRDR